MPPDISAEGGVIGCLSGQDTLSGSSTSVGVSYSWTGPGGFVSNLANPIAATLGIYTLVVTSPNGCTSTQDVELVASQDAPQVAVNDGILNCINTSTELIANSENEGLTYSWTGPDGFTADGPMITVNSPGIYTVTGVNEDGCAGSASTNVIDDTQVPEVNIAAGNLNCLLGATQFTTTGASFSWSGPENFTSSQQNPEVSVPGNYILTVTAENGCTAIDSADVAGDPDLPIVSATGGTIDCTNEEVMLMGSTESTGATIKWEGPNGFTSSNANPTVDIPGTYTFTATSTGDCVAFTSVEVILDKRDPDLAIAEGSINCEAGTRNFNLATNANDGSFQWVGPDGYTSSDLNATYTVAGVYMVTVTGTNGCFTAGSIEVDHDINYESNLTISGDDVMVEIIGGTPPFSIFYDGAIEGPDVMDLAQGDHFVEITDGLNCQKRIEFTIMSTSIFEEQEVLDIKIYPNPVVNELRVDWSKSEVKAEKLTIISSNGQLINSRFVGGGSQLLISTEDLTEGLYYLKVEGKDALIFKKFLKI